MELDMYGDPKKPCCVCKKGADLNEKENDIVPIIMHFIF